MSSQKLKEMVEEFIEHPYAWPGGYPRYLCLVDGDMLCATCTKEEKRFIFEDINEIEQGGSHNGWFPALICINWEDEYLFCSHCNKKIESAYGGNDED